MKRIGEIPVSRRLLLVVFLSTVAPEAASSRQFHVPGDFSSIQAAIDGIAPGDSILVAPGNWTHRETRIVHLGSVDQIVTSCGFLKAPLTIIGTGGADATIVDAGGSGPGFLDTFLLANEPHGDVVLEGMTITGAGSNAAAVIGIDSDSIVIKSCKINGNQLGQHGIAVQGNHCDLVILDSEVSFNNGGSVGGLAGVALIDQADIELRRTRLEGNKGLGLYAGWSAPGPAVTITDCEFVGNKGNDEAFLPGGGAAIGTIKPVVIERNLFMGNVPSRWYSIGGGLLLGGGLSGSIRFNTFAFDSAEGGGGIAVQEPSPQLIISQNTFVGCHSENGGSAVSVSNVAPAFEFSNNIVCHSTGDGAVMNLSGRLLEGGCNDYWENYGGDFGNGWQVQPLDFFLDPQFCDLDEFDLTVSDTSPCAQKVNSVCGQVGAWGVGCGTVSLQPFTWGKIKSLYR